MQKNMQVLDYAFLRRRIYEYKEKYPFAGYSVCARTWSGRAIFTLSLGEKRNPVLFVAGVRGGDRESVSVMLDFFASLCDCVQNNSEIAGIRVCEVLKEKGIVIIPCLNPDGMEITLNGAVAAGSYAGLVERVCSNTSSWRANARGVDLSLNFSEGFSASKKVAEGCGYTAPGPYFYAGKVPESEPETRAMVKICKSVDIRHTVSLRSGGGYICSPDLSFCGDRAEMMCRILELSSGMKRIKDSSVPLEKDGFSDWFVQKYKKPAFVINAQGDEKEIYKCIEETLVLSIVM